MPLRLTAPVTFGIFCHDFPIAHYRVSFVVIRVQITPGSVLVSDFQSSVSKKLLPSVLRAHAGTLASLQVCVSF
jgi:hypothetical protein